MERTTLMYLNNQLKTPEYQSSQPVNLPNEKRIDHNDVRISDEAFDALKEWTSEFVDQKAI